MGLKRLLGSRATRSLTVLSVCKAAKRAFDRGSRTRAVLLLGLAVLAWKWAILGLVAQGVLTMLRARKPGSGST
ncbi:hypothetical protein [Natrarchaeobaculum sulfurireducens]|uniref:Uncharacterized protein n=1 Tax=Natrarchaeobaculum sulfurireducens TaxID=2044521 RepID=A0A346PUV1_9EURY|nr:hypothetical protein [Natrarchaeobaculum sulfurireducens]AXR83296.1 hypothetical protein AArcMg_3312 [Natrarchaeobaculum sulfurireducens]